MQDGLSLVALDLRSDDSVAACARGIGASVGLIVTTAEMMGDGDTAEARDVMETICGGLLRLSRHLGLIMQARCIEIGKLPPKGWVNLLSAYGLADASDPAGRGVALAAALSLYSSMRSEFLPYGLRVMTVLTVPVAGAEDTDQLEAETLALAVIAALVSGQEEVSVVLVPAQPTAGTLREGA